jgi:hypothetical protein
MRLLKVALTATAVAASLGLLAGCSGSGSTVPQTLSQTSPTRYQAQHRDATGVATRYLSLLRFGAHAPAATHPDLSSAKRFAVSDFGTGAVEVLKGNYALHQTITSGLNGPDGNFYDMNGRLYVANYAGINVTEYAQGGTTPIFTYSTGLTDPIAVTTDKTGNVFVGDYAFGGSGFVNEYAQGSNTVLNSCSPGGSVEGIAVGKTGKVFVAYNDSNTGTAKIAKYNNGLAGCNETVLGVSLGFAGGMQIANNKSLVVCDQFAGIDIIPPPYTSVGSTIGGYSDPFHVALNKGNTLMFVADVGNALVYVQNYPSGSAVTTLGAANGLVDPAGIATFPYLH